MSRLRRDRLICSTTGRCWTPSAEAAQYLEISNLRREASTESALSFAWDNAATEMETPNFTYNVQVSIDDGQTWQTVAVTGRPRHRPRRPDGFTSTVAETETFSVDEPDEQ